MRSPINRQAAEARSLQTQLTPNPISKEHFLRMMLELPAGDFRAYLFDCDGTIVDSMPLHYKAWKQALGEYGCEFPEKLFYEWGGKPIHEIVSTLNQMHGLHMPVDKIAEYKEGLYFAQLPTLKVIPETLEHIEAQYGKIPFAVVSGGRRNSVEHSLTTVDLIDKFPVIVGAGDYKRSKPAPDPFLTAAEILGVPPEHCLVFEDTDLGIQSATAAGMASVLVPGPLERAAAGTTQA
jgi:HAD superfamily hydrolase (TIGR01509 family)